MVLNNQAHEPAQQMTALLLAQPINLLHVRSNREDALPASNGVSADHRVLGAEFVADVLGCAAGSWVDFEVVVLGYFVEAWLGVGGCERFEEFLVWLGDAVVYFVSGGPEGVCRCVSK